MKKVTTKQDEKRVLEYIRPHIGECIYLYIDVMVYGIESPILDLWYDEDEDGINFVIMRYNDSLQIYSDREDWDKKALMDIVEEYDIQAVNAKNSMLDQLEEELSAEYEKRPGWVFKSRDMADLDVEGASDVEVAKPEDAKEIAALMCSTPHWRKLYKEEKLAAQLEDRMRTGMGRSLIVRDGGRIVAHDATWAETEDIVMGSGLVVDENYLDRMYSISMSVAMDRILREEGKEKYFHVSDPARMKMFKKMGHKLVGETGKWMKVK